MLGVWNFDFMPKDEFDFEDPFELNGMAFMTHEDTTHDMAETFIEEFMRMGYGHKQILALFRNPHYLGPNMALEKRGEPFIRDLITEIFARWGKAVTWSSVTPNPLTPALSPSEGERENRSPFPRASVAAGSMSVSGFPKTPFLQPPPPRGGGEGQGEGAHGRPASAPVAQTSKSAVAPISKSARRGQVETHAGLETCAPSGSETDATELTDPTGAPIPDYTV